MTARWYQEAVIYELHVKGFADSDGDGIGDFNGLRTKLDYLQDLGVTALWLLPFNPSPLRDDGYDIADYSSINPSYGDLRSFRRVLKEAHQRDLRIITELVINHTSDQHPWFQRARTAPPGSRHRDFYVWSDDPQRYSGTRIIFQDFEPSNWTWDPVAESYYWHRFYHHQPDLNFDNPAVHDAVFKVLDHWLAMGIDGVRLDAVPYLYEREGTNCENLPETHQFLKKLRAHVDARFDDRMLLAEANQWPEDAAAYFGDGDECQMNFHFPVMPRLFMAVRQENRTPIVDIMEQTPPPPEGCQWATFLRNHDELTLEMVTDEERDYMYRSYGNDQVMRLNQGIRRRLAPLMGGDRRKLELLNALLFAMPGTPVVYYGDEIGMGDNIYLGDRDGVRTPMQWTSDRNAGFSTASPHALYLPPVTTSDFHYERVNVESQRGDPSSLLNWMRQLIAVRRRLPQLASGRIEFLEPENHHVLAFLRSHDGHDPILVVANLSRLAQSVELDLRAHIGARPHELFGGHDFAPVGELPYYVTLSPYAIFWFRLSHRPTQVGEPSERELPTLDCTWDASRSGRTPPLLDALRSWMPRQRWFGSKDRAITGMSITADIPVGQRRRGDVRLVLVDVGYRTGEPDTYAVPLAVVSGHRAHWASTFEPESVVAALANENLIVDATCDSSALAALIRTLVRPSRRDDEIEADTTPALRRILRRITDDDVRRLGAEQSNTSLVVDDEVLIKLFRRVERGENPDLQISRHLAKVGLRHVPNPQGSLSRRRSRSEWDTLAIAYDFVPNEGDGWSRALSHLSLLYDDLLTGRDGVPPDEAETVTDGVAALGVELLGQRTAELHVALGEATPDGGLGVEPFTALYQRSLYQGFRSAIKSTLGRLRRVDPSQVDPDLAAAVLDGEKQLTARLEPLRDRVLAGQRIRCHGDYHLGQVLYTGSDWMIIDFEGEPNRPISERQILRSPATDVAGMLRSFDYAATVGLRDRVERALLDDIDDPVAGRCAARWRDRAAESFLAGYFGQAEVTSLWPDEEPASQTLIDLYLLDKALHELRYELANRPAWAGIPLRQLRALAEGDPVAVGW